MIAATLREIARLLGGRVVDVPAPVLRGAWILESITGTPPASPPPNVPALEETSGSAGGRLLSVRERMSKVLAALEPARRAEVAGLLKGNVVLPADARVWLAVLGGTLPPLAPEAHFEWRRAASASVRAAYSCACA